MNKGFCADVQLIGHDGSPLSVADVLIDVTLFVGEQIRYQFCLGGTDESGRFQFTYDDVERARLRGRESALMDYNTPLSDCGPNMRVSVPSQKELQERYDALGKWYPDNKEMLERIRRMLDLDLDCDGLEVEVNCKQRVSVQLVCKD
jgi:hypothetical protein